MTFSIVACDLKEKTWGVAVASKFPAVGAVVPWAQADAGAVATQSFANTSFGPRGLQMMAQGLSADETLGKHCSWMTLTAKLRQVGLVDAKGHAATFTGSGCFPLGWRCDWQRICNSRKYSGKRKSCTGNGKEIPRDQR